MEKVGFKEKGGPSLSVMIHQQARCLPDFINVILEMNALFNKVMYKCMT